MPMGWQSRHLLANVSGSVWSCSRFSNTVLDQSFRTSYYVGVSSVFARPYSKWSPEDKVKPPLKTKRYVFDKVVKFITDSTDKLEKRAPRVYKVYKTFRTGVSLFVSDTKEYAGVARRLWSGASLTEFSRRDLELYRQFSSDLPLVGLMLIIAFAPGGVFVFPLAYTFPRQLLSHHFWTPEQQHQFLGLEMRAKGSHSDSVLDCMRAQAGLKEAPRGARELVSKLDNGMTLTPKEILSLAPLFEGTPFKMSSLHTRHRYHLSRSLGMPVWPRKLVKDGLLMHYTDLAMQREGIARLRGDDLDRACSWRGLNPQGVSGEEKRSYLEAWAGISGHINESRISLLLHLPILLGQAHQANRKCLPQRQDSRSRD